MGFSCGLVGLPNVGKSTIFNALTNAGAKVENYPFTTIEANVGVVAVPDPRLDQLHKLFPEKKKVPTTLHFVDIAGLVKGASEGQGLGNQFLSEIRNVDAIVHVVRCFEDPNVVHVDGALDPKRDIEVIETELMLKDLEIIEKRAKSLASRVKVGDKSAKAEYEFYLRLREALAQGRPIRSVSLHEHERPFLKELNPLTLKPVLFAANVGDGGENEFSKVVERLAAERGTKAIVLRGRLEAEVVEAAETEEERQVFRREWGIEESGLERLIRAGYELLHLVTFYTIDGPEVRAWTVVEGTHAPQAGAKIHTDFAERFVQCEVARWDELVKEGSLARLREKGHLYRHGEKYIVQDGDVIHFVVA
ncbi:MAG: redox-regulated ATPase YchF [Candidatus Bipolaricaulota bacterium]|nr:redox-regulated ATPase YchF [Candidatus Bipolaricaulota bacterium]MCS7274847.1 redox-regulated ATPase YchF [Candidatus Bipolaricaulota bacterium]MDW8111268.1 redox-regulated ATPase YchF [Candidatus Bipolaricaulota bacterium]MDW8328596.1 redox-regulated ATPase YchF [Candidatus Bipolaricaulota bacterium]